ncbi:APOBEC1 complementation factor-like isoform X2 [Harmonia axyridis]|uniref:APOBEC1 complementation factor-like isoform X2 n=1 Tax=Harmonia axyridis TaxID=115357 RepID=UPI001E2761BE|nr:APOBEC1 complementation factor-like isoform X2 [Harmonia axyridis]
MAPAIKCFEHPMKLRENRCQRVLTTTKVSEDDSLGYELFVSKIPSDADEDELIPFFEEIGPLHTFRLMMKYNQSGNRGHAYVTYICEQDAKTAVFQLNGKEIREGQHISVNRSFNNCRIFIGGIPVCKTKDEVWHELQRQGVPNITDVIMYRSYSNRNLNRGFVFVEFPCHKFAAKMRLKLRGLKLWNYEVVVDWSVPQPVVSEEEMARVKKVYLRNLDVTQTREALKATIESYLDPGAIEKVYKFKDYAFIHLSTRELALKLVEFLKEHYKDTFVEVSLAKPRSQYTKPGYRKFQMMKNNPYLPKSYTESVYSAPNSILDSPPSRNLSSPSNLNSPQRPSNLASTQNWIHSLPLSPTCSPTSSDPCDIYQWDEYEQYFNEELTNPMIHFNYLPKYHLQNRFRDILQYNEQREIDNLATSFNSTMNNLNVCCPGDYFWKFQDKLERQHDY